MVFALPWHLTLYILISHSYLHCQCMADCECQCERKKASKSNSNNNSTHICMKIPSMQRVISIFSHPFSFFFASVILAFFGHVSKANGPFFSLFWFLSSSMIWNGGFSLAISMPLKNTIAGLNLCVYRVKFNEAYMFMSINGAHVRCSACEHENWNSMCPGKIWIFQPI